MSEIWSAQSDIGPKQTQRFDSRNGNQTDSKQQRKGAVTQPAPLNRFGRLIDSLDAYPQFESTQREEDCMNRQYCSIRTAGFFLLAFLAFAVTLSAQVGTEGSILG